jgi:hypothetical protein
VVRSQQAAWADLALGQFGCRAEDGELRTEPTAQLSKIFRFSSHVPTFLRSVPNGRTQRSRLMAETTWQQCDTSAAPPQRTRHAAVQISHGLAVDAPAGGSCDLTPAEFV